ncbi:alpha/beta hydrolase [Sphingopyxis sp.]|uniref:alpha/beta hydrolase n=1 Tax=Sphingopyxis sp. TaxID=1908224 RepID=UPI003D6D1473
MSNRATVDPELAPVLGVFPKFELSDQTIGEVRRMLGQPRPDAPAPAIAPSEHFVPVGDAAPSVRLLVFDPPGRPAGGGALLHMHAGGTVMGSADVSSIANAALARDLGIIVVSVDYRLAPEAPYPAPLDDCFAAYRWLLSEAAEFGIDPGRIAVGGESAGGLLAAALALRARDSGVPLPCLQLLSYPMLDHRTGSDAFPGAEGTGEHIWTRSANRYAWKALAGPHVAADTLPAWFSPAITENLEGLPRTWIGVGSIDLFFDENHEYARRLAAAGVAVELQSYPGAFHAFDMVETAAVTRRYRSDIRRILGEATGPRA